MTGKENLQSGPKSIPPDRASGGLADSSVNEAPATPGGPPSQDEGRHKIPRNEQREGLEKAEEAGGSPAKP